MALVWNTEKIADYQNVCFKNFGTDESELLGRTETMIWLLMFVGITKITAENHKDVFKRIYIYEKVNGSLRRHAGEDKIVRDLPITYEDVRLHIGLSTNVSTSTRTEFNKKLEDIAGDELNRQVRVAQQAKEQAA